VPAKPPALHLDAGPAAGWEPSDALVASLARLLRALARNDTGPAPQGPARCDDAVGPRAPTRRDRERL
jgi:hypothetical protein